jgi:hypothetical protein
MWPLNYGSVTSRGWPSRSGNGSLVTAQSPECRVITPGSRHDTGLMWFAVASWKGIALPLGYDLTGERQQELSGDFRDDPEKD